MPTDIAIDSVLDTYWNDVGDIATVSDTEYVEQVTSVAILETVGLSPPTLTPTAIEEHRGEIETAVVNCHATQEPVSVSVSDVDATAGTIQYSVETATAEFPISFT